MPVRKANMLNFFYIMGTVKQSLCWSVSVNNKHVCRRAPVDDVVCHGHAGAEAINISYTISEPTNFRVCQHKQGKAMPLANCRNRQRAASAKPHGRGAPSRTQAEK